MIDIVFSDSACGSLKMAQRYGCGKYVGGATGVFISKGNGKKPTKAEIKSAQEKYDARERLAWENAVPLGGNPDDVFGFNLMLSVGDISEENFIENRHKVLDEMYSIHQYGEPFDFTKKYEDSLREIRDRLSGGESLRIWYSDNPEESCGLYWFMAQINCIKDKLGEIYLVKMPQWDFKGEKEIRQHRAWGEIAPSEWHKYLDKQELVPNIFVNCCCGIWKSLQSENAPLRAVINGVLLSVSETLYDSFIIREIDEEEDEFFEVRVIGSVLGKYALGIGDCWVAHRIEKMIAEGRLSAVTTAEADAPIYHRMLKKAQW